MQTPTYKPAPSLWNKSLVLWVVIAGLVLVASITGHLFIGPDTDHIIQINDTSRMLSGGTPYVAFSNVNTPLTYLLYAVPVWLSSAVPLQPATLLWLFAYAMEIASLACCHHILRRSGFSTLAIIASLITIGLALTAISYQHQVFGDREHMMMVLITPWLLFCAPLAKPAAVSPRMRLAIAIFAGLGFALKPYALWFYLATIIAQRLQKRPTDWRAHITVGAVLLAYCGVIALFFPAYMLEVFPLIWYSYDASCWSFPMRWGAARDMASQYWPLAFFSSLALLFPRPVIDRTIVYFAGLLATAMLAFLLGQGWYYTQYPLMALIFMLAIYASGQMLKASFIHTGERVPSFLLIVALLGTTVSQLAYPCYVRAIGDLQSQQNTGHPLAVATPDFASDQALDRLLGPTSHYLFLGTEVRALGIQKYERQSVGRYDSLWPLNGMIMLHQDPTKEYLYNFIWPTFIKTLTQDIAIKTPDRIVVDTSPQQIPLPSNFAIMPFLLQDPGFATVMADYELKEHVNSCRPELQWSCAFDVYARKASKPKPASHK